MAVGTVDSADGLSGVRDYTDLADLLWRERGLLEQVLFELAVEQLVVSAGQSRWLPMANRRLELALEQVRATEIARSVESDRICDALGISTAASLAEISTLAPPPWDSILLEHREALINLADEVRATADQNQRLLDIVSRAVHDTLASITASIGTYDHTGAANTDFSRLSRLDEQA